MDSLATRRWALRGCGLKSKDQKRCSRRSEETRSGARAVASMVVILGSRRLRGTAASSGIVSSHEQIKMRDDRSAIGSPALRIQLLITTNNYRECGNLRCRGAGLELAHLELQARGPHS
jgi:hypothetical protein